MKRAISIVLSLALIAGISTSALAQPTKLETDPPSRAYAEEEAIVCVNGDISSLNARNRSLGFEVTPLMEISGDDTPVAYSNDINGSQEETLVLVKGNQDTESLIEDLEKLPTVEFAEPNYYVEMYASPEDPYYDYQWGIENKMETDKAVDANIAEAWDKTSSPTSEAPVVAVLDSGVDYNHPDLKNIMWDDGLKYPELTAMGGGTYGFNVCDGEDLRDDPMDTIVGHGTHCAGVIAAQWDNAEGGAGVSADAEIMAVKFLGGANGNLAGAIEGYAYIQAAKESGVNVVAINNSWGTSAYNGIQLQSIAKATEALGELGVVSCFAAGNSGTNNDLNTGSNLRSPYIITVGALESQGHNAPFSCYGERTVDVFAPGAQILAPTSSDTSISPYNEHTMPPQYLPQLMDEDQSYFYEDFEDGSSVALRVLDKDGQVVEDNQTSLTPGYIGGKGTQISLDGINEGEIFYIEMTFQKSDFVGLDTIDENTLVHFAFQASMGSSCLEQTMPLMYQDANGEWQILSTTQLVSGQYYPARLRMMDYNWNQSTQELKDASFLKNEGDTITLRLGGEMKNKEPGITFQLDNVGFGKEAIPYYYADGTSMATPMVSGIVALLSAQYDDAAEICARVKGGVNREDAIGLEDICVSGGFVDAAASFEDSQLVPVLNTLEMDGNKATLSGYFFGEEQGTILVGDEQVEVKSWSDNTITFTVPEGTSGLQEVLVTAQDGQYGRNFFEITDATKGYTDLSTPDFSYGDIYGYELTSSDIYPLSMAAAGGKILTLGIIVETSQLVMEVYDIESDTWSQASMPDDIQFGGGIDYPLYSMAGGLTKIYLNYSTATGQQKLGTYDTATGTWTSVNTTLGGTEALAVYQDQLLAIGGEVVDENLVLQETLKSVKVLDPSTGEIIGNLPDMPVGRSGARAFASGDTLVVYGGCDSVIYSMIGKETTEYSNTIVYDGTTWTNYEEDQFLSDENSAFDSEQTLYYAIGAVDGGVIVTGPVQNLGQDNMVDTWNFDAATGTWSGSQDILYSQVKTTRNIGVSYDGRFYALGITGDFNQPQIFRSTAVNYTGPTKDPSSEQETLTLPVTYTYKGNVVAQEEVTLSEGSNTVTAAEDLAQKYGFTLQASEENEVTVQVTKDPETGALKADVDAVNFNVIPTIDPTEYSFHVSYEDMDGNPVAGGGDMYFEDIGPFSNEDIPLPYGYQQVIPAHPGEDWLYPTSLVFEDGQWVVTNPEVVLVVEPTSSSSGGGSGTTSPDTGERSPLGIVVLLGISVLAVLWLKKKNCPKDE